MIQPLHLRMTLVIHILKVTFSVCLMKTQTSIKFQLKVSLDIKDKISITRNVQYLVGQVDNF